jgi:predicted RNA-binding Zn-ribbon protein involved in translation (DUF1610 family)
MAATRNRMNGGESGSVKVACPECGRSRLLVVGTTRKSGFTGLCNRCKNQPGVQEKVVEARRVGRPPGAASPPKAPKRSDGMPRAKPSRATEVTMRKCLRCPKVFRSHGYHEQLCPQCRDKNQSVSDQEEIYKYWL